eukprot:Em0008g1055a
MHFDDASAWIQATLSVSAGGIGIHRAAQLALSAFLASAAGTRSLIYEILPERMATILYPAYVTCPDTFATSYEIQAASEGVVATLVEWKKKTKYEAIAQTHLFYPIAIETSGVFGPAAYEILCDLARRIRATSNEPNSKGIPFPQISVVVQRSVLGCAGGQVKGQLRARQRHEERTLRGVVLGVAVKVGWTAESGFRRTSLFRVGIEACQLPLKSPHYFSQVIYYKDVKQMVVPFNHIPSIVASVVVICAVAVVAAIVIIILIYKGVLRRRRTPTRPATDGLDNVIYNGSCTTVAAGSIYATYEPLNDKQETSSHVNYDYLEEDCNPYITPASHEEELYMQLESKKLKKIPRHQIEANEMLGSGQFGGVQIGIWNGSKGRCEVAIKTLNPTTTQPDAKVKFLQEAAIMVQFRHPNIIQLYGIVLDGEPITLVLELANKKDLRTHLGTMRPEYVCGWIGTRMITIYPSPGQMLQPDLPLRLLNYSKQTAAGMKYLSSKSFVHRDLAARNILVTKDCICKIADFGLSRDLADDTYYVSHGGMVPIKWTAPEAIHFKKYSTASDVWSYGCLLYEIWSMGVKPFEEKSNAEVVQKVDSGYRLPPPPGCPQLIYQLMIQCWNPATHSRPLFKDIYQSLCQSEELVLAIPCDVHLIHPNAGMVGASLEAGQNLYIELQKSYLQV